MEACSPITPTHMSHVLSPSTAPPSGSPVSTSYSPAMQRIDMQRTIDECVKEQVKEQIKVLSERQFQQNAVLWKRVSDLQTSQETLTNRVKHLEMLLRDNKIQIPVTPNGDAVSISSFALSPEPGNDQIPVITEIRPTNNQNFGNPADSNWWQGTG